MDRATKAAIKRLAVDARYLLKDDIRVVLKRYLLYIDRAWLLPDKISKAATRRGRWHRRRESWSC